MRRAFGLFLLLLLFWAAPALAEGPPAEPDPTPWPAEAVSPELTLPDSLLTDFVSLYTNDWRIGARETACWLGAIAFLVSVDAPLYDYIHANLGSPAIDEFSALVTNLGAGTPPLLITAIVWMDNPKAGQQCLEAMLFAGINCKVLKNLLGMARPYLGLGPVFTGFTTDNDYEAMPSGHTSNAFALATVLAATYPKYRWLFYAAASLVGLSRIYLEKHWPSNVLAGALLGIYCGQRVLRNEFTVFHWAF